MGGSTNWEGQVEMYISGMWVTINDQSWTTAEAQVVCRQLGHSTESESLACRHHDLVVECIKVIDIGFSLLITKSLAIYTKQVDCLE